MEPANLSVLANDPDRLDWPDLVAEGIEARERRDGAQYALARGLLS